MIKSILIGCGNIGFDYDSMNPQYNQTHFRALYNDKRFSLVVAIDENLNKQSLIKNAYGVDCLGNLSQVKLNILNHVDLIVISTSEGSKVRILNQISELSLTPKVILYEKPVATTTHELNSLFTCLQSLSTEIRFNFMRRAHPTYRWLKSNFEKITGAISPLYLQVNFSGNLHNSLSHAIDFLVGLLGKAKFENAQISALDNMWIVKNEYFHLTIQRIDLNVSIFDVIIMSDKVKINYSHTNEELTMTKVGHWYDFKGNFYTKDTDHFDFSASNYMAFTYDEVYKLVNNRACALTDLNEAVLTFDLIERLRSKYV